MYNQNQPRVPAGDPAGGQWAGGNVSRTAFDKMSAVDRSAHLKSGGQVSDDHITELLQRVAEPDGGFTYQPFSDLEPTEGFALSIHPERSFATDASRLKFNDLVKYVMKNRDLLSDKENFLGAWHDPDSHKVFLDISRVVKDRSRATHLARQHDQIAYFDLKTKQSVTVNKHATSGGVA